MKYRLQDLIDIDHFQNLQDRLNEICSFPSSIIDNDGKILTATAWQDVCTKFHRKNKESERICIQSDQYIQDHIHEANPAVTYRCPHGLVDNAMPIIIEGVHCGNFFTGQFFLEEPDLEFFRTQAQKYEFDEDAYLSAVKKVPIWTQEQLNNYLFFIRGLITVITESALKKLKEVETQKQLEDKETRQRSIIQTAMDGFWLTDTAGKLLEANNSYCSMSGYSEAELLTMRIADLDANESPEFVDAQIKETVSLGSDRFESKHRRKDGLVFDVEVSAQFRNEDGGRFVAFLKDITARKQAEQRLMESRAKLLQAQYIARIGDFTWDLTSGAVTWSDGMHMLLKYDRSEKIDYAKVNAAIHHPDDLDRVTQWLTNSISSGKNRITPNEYRIVCKDGEILYVHTEGKIEYKDGKAVKLFGTCQDITARKKVELELIEQKQIAERYLNLAGVIFIGLDQDGNVDIANQKACDVLECKKTDILGRNWFENFIPPRFQHDVRSVFKQLTDGNMAPVEYYENPIITKSGREKTIAWHNNYLTDNDGKIIGTLGSGEDITEKRHLQEQLQQAQKMESIGTLAGGIAHDFNNILSSMIGFTELALDDAAKGTPLEDSLQEIYAAGKRAKDLVKQILAFARQANEENKPIQPGIITKEAINFIRASIPATIEIRQNIDTDSLIMGNATQIHQILLNLFTNAAHAMEDKGGILEVGIKDIAVDEIPNTETNNIKKLNLNPGDYIEIKVSDTGAGIAPEIIGSIFEPYFTTKGPGEGTGMGLAVVHGIVESYNGKITVDSALDKGTVFSIYLPITKKRGPDQQYVEEDLPSGTERILFIDDEPPIAKMATRILERWGYQVTVRTSSVKALELFRAKPDDFDLVITDMTMPGMTGDKLALELMQIRPDLPVILFTGYSKNISDEIASEIGIKGFAYKPVIKTDLAKTIRNVLDEVKGATQD